MPDTKLINWIDTAIRQGRSKKEIVSYLASKGYSSSQINEAFKFMQSNKQNVSTGGFGFWDKLKYLFSDPNLFFEKVKSESGIKNSLLIYAIAGAFVGIVSFAFTSTFSIIGGGYGGRFYSFLGPAFAFGSIGIGIVMTFFYSALIHAIVTAFKGEGKYSDTYNAYTYSMVPFLILSMVPLIGFLSIIYSLILMTIGVSKVHNISKGKSALACILPGAVILGILITFVILYFTRIF